MNVPKLRFKEFNDEYVKLKYKDVLKIKSGKDQKQVENKNGKYPILGTGGQIGKTNSFLYDKPSVLIGRKGTINKPQYMKSPFWTVDTLFYSHIYEPNIPKYLFYSFQNVNWKKYDESTGVPSLSSSTIENVECNIPSPNEQIKVANFLSLLDKKIELQTKKIEDLKLFKKGLINVLNKKSYQETALGKIGKFQTSSIDKLIKENEKIVNLYNYMDVYKHKILMTQDLSKLSKTSAKDNQITINNLKRGDILFTPSSETPEDIGHSICIQEDLPNTVYSYHLLRYRPNIIMDPLFSNYYFNNSKIRKQIIRYATGATRYTISLDSFLKIKVNIPDLITQKKYGLLLYSTDKKVNKELLKLTKLQELKKGLMQNMFV